MRVAANHVRGWWRCFLCWLLIWAELAFSARASDLFSLPPVRLRSLDADASAEAEPEMPQLHPRVRPWAPEGPAPWIVAPLVFEQGEVLDLQIRVHEDPERFWLESAPLLERLETMVEPATWRRLAEAAVAGRGSIPMSEFLRAGFGLEFDPETVTLRLQVPPRLRSPSRIQLYSREPPRLRQTPLEPASFSAYLNARFGVDYVHATETGERGWEPIRTDFEAAAHWHDWVVESQFLFAEEAVHPWTRGETRLVRDDPQRAIRYAVGDLSYPVSGFQAFQPMLGLTLARNFSLRPYDVVEPLGATQFYLRNPSRVEVLVNGRTVQTLQLPAGPHHIRSFPFISGGNEVVLRITDDVGRVTIERFSFFFDPRLLVQGEHEFAYSAGVLTDRSAGRLEYDLESPGVSMFHRFGLTDRLTLGGNFQGTEAARMIGGEAVWATPYGVFTADLAFSHGRDQGWDAATRLQYRISNEDEEAIWIRIWNLSVQHRGEGFSPLVTGPSRNPVEWDLRTRFNQRLPHRFQVGLGGSYQNRREGFRNTSSLHLFFGKQWRRNLLTELNLDRSHTLEGEREDRLFLTVTWLLDDFRQSLTATHDTQQGVSRLHWHYQPEYLVGGLQASAGVVNTPDRHGASASARYVSYRSDTFLAHDFAIPHGFEGGRENRTSFRLGTALVYADGAWGLSRPIQESFAIAATHPGLRDHPVGLDPVHGTYAARQTKFGPAVLPDLTGYLYRNVVIDAPDLPLGYELGEPLQTLHPTYRSGIVVPVGRGPIVILEGALRDEAGELIPLEAGYMVFSPTGEKHSFFTDRSGRFSVAGLFPGKYRLFLEREPERELHFEIPKEGVGVYDIRELQFSNRETQ